MRILQALAIASLALTLASPVVASERNLSAVVHDPARLSTIMWQSSMQCIDDSTGKPANLIVWSFTEADAQSVASNVLSTGTSPGLGGMWSDCGKSLVDFTEVIVPN